MRVITLGLYSVILSQAHGIMHKQWSSYENPPYEISSVGDCDGEASAIQQSLSQLQTSHIIKAGQESQRLPLDHQQEAWIERKGLQGDDTLQDFATVENKESKTTLVAPSPPQMDRTHINLEEVVNIGQVHQEEPFSVPSCTYKSGLVRMTPVYEGGVVAKT
ncbi:uncharacterized protein MELLADRAFT_101839 [Melampsora larici-populina 98AG31]|uniref:Secreted protein n=1 Tax=Melampsora larici-populina (strain 98AG31 / pathotype 3-4-7) TaxID=747676 RepID=F4R527_MELLP|nr:uncharacterized protein MELLADRAFT_101839 [Melampsora larici-populina 98AG31]EGG11986.1 hypothetical protein MELLADRAFT_101839 [Melampsora larici-populina 98AG31]